MTKTLCHAALALALLASEPALAHTGAGGAGDFASGFLHPILGPDHVVAMLAVGLWGVFLGAPAIWALPIVFPLVMALGGAFGMIGVPLPAVETGIALSAAVIVGVFAIFHGSAHGTEMPESSSAVPYALGFVLATGPLHLGGILVGTPASWDAGRVAVRAAGGLIALAGGAFLTGLA